MRFPKIRTLPLLGLIIALLAFSWSTSVAHSATFSNRLTDWGLEIRILPSSPLYRIKLLWENLQLLTAAPTSEEKALLLIRLCNRRLKELEQDILDEQTILSDEERFTIVSRYQELFSTLEDLLSSPSNYQAVEKQLQLLLDNRDKLKEKLKEPPARLTPFWKEEISYRIFSPELPATYSHNFTQRPKNSYSRNVLGSSKHRGLELYPLNED